jgi:hypothetical protein
MRLQAQCKALPDGEISVCVDGEALRVTVKDGAPSVEAFTGEPEKTLTHLEALRYFLAPYTILRDGDALAQC